MKYKVIGPVARFGADTLLGLTKEQAAPRAHQLDDAGKGLYRPTTEVQFKNGEIVDLSAKPEDLPRYLNDILEPVTKPKKAASEDGKPNDGAPAQD